MTFGLSGRSQHQPTLAIDVIQSKQGGHRLATLGVRDTLLVAWFSTWERVMKMVIEVLMETVNNYQDDFNERKRNYDNKLETIIR